MKRMIPLLISAIFIAGAAGTASAQRWPERTITIVVPGSGGSAPDIIARILADRLTPRLGQPIVIENKLGAAGTIGTATVARAAPDGHTLLFGLAASLTLSQHVFTRVQYDSQRDLTPIIMIGMSPFLIAATSSLGVDDLPGLVALAKAKPGVLNYGTSSSHNLPHLTGELLKRRLGINIVHVPYRTGQNAIVDTISGQMHVLIDGVPSVLKLGGTRLKLLATTATARIPGLDNVPSVSETLPGFAMQGWFAMLGPAGLPEPIVTRLNAELREQLGDKAIAARMRDLGVFPVGGTPQDLARTIREESDLLAKVVAEAGLARLKD